ncbi:MAG: hypothetical protein HYZ00_02310, partial [Candidatus Hydrogenedentes bacterium]|nr:hypothetical protein [Candidatus Hydrogenedentota bacterium]
MYVRGLLGVVTLLLSAAAWAAEVHEGVLTVGGRPFYPLGSWNFEETTPEDIAKLGMNTSFRGGPGTEAGVVEFRRFMQRCHELGIEVVPYLSYGG